ncbi:hypothetical protein VAWG006_22840 [Aeromonas enteropelogenes]|nr:hypothetical protein VAWG006_22840 [Aeromonas enteropelogenes]
MTTTHYGKEVNVKVCLHEELGYPMQYFHSLYKEPFTMVKGSCYLALSGRLFGCIGQWVSNPAGGRPSRRDLTGLPSP